MPTLETLFTLVLESVLYGTMIGIALAAAIAIAMQVFGPLNAATRAGIWSLALVTLPFIPALYLLGHLPVPAKPTAPVIQVSAPKPSAPAAPSTIPVISAPITRSPAARALSVELPEHFSEVLLTAYAVIVGFLLFRLFVSYIRLRLLRRRTQTAPPELAARLQLWLARCPTARAVELRLSQRARSPLAIGFLKPVIVMPAGLVMELSQQEYDDLGVHELAHLRRYDDWTNLLQRILQAFLFFHPAAYYIGRELNLEREIACDDWVVSAHEGRSYARCLTKVIELRRYHRGALALSSGAFFGKRQIVKRVESLLDKTRNSATGVSSVTVACCVLAVIGILSQVINLPAVVAFTQDEAGPHSDSRWVDDSHDLRIKQRGEVTFSADEQSVATLSPGGYFIVDEAKGWSRRRLEVRPGPDGAPVQKYFIDGREKPMDGVGRAWTASSFLFALREMGLDAEGRVGRIVARRGAAGVIEEVGRIHSDHVKCEYLTQILEQAKLTESDLQRVTDSIRKISSDNDKADFLIAHEKDLDSDKVRTSYFAAINSIGSDNDRRRVLMHLLETDGNTPETARLIGLSARTMSSDIDKADVLLALPAATSADGRCEVLTAAKTISSDNDKARVLHDSGYADSPACRDAWFAVANLISSDNDRSEVLQSLLRNDKLAGDTFQNIANSAKKMNSDNEKANVLTQLGARYTATPFFDAVNTIQSSNDRARTLKSVLEHNPARADLLEVINSAAGLPDDNEKTELLLAVAKLSKEPEVRSALQKACEKISSDNDYRRVASAIFSGGS